MTDAEQIVRAVAEVVGVPEAHVLGIVEIDDALRAFWDKHASHPMHIIVPRPILNLARRVLWEATGREWILCRRARRIRARARVALRRK